MKPFHKPTTGFRQCVGVDVSKETLSASMCMQSWGDAAQFTLTLDFPNTKNGFNRLVKWSRSEALKDYPIHFLMEPTGTYYEDLAYHLSKLKFIVYVVPPARVKAFCKEEGIKTKTDHIDAAAMALMGCNKPHMKAWTPPLPLYRELRQLTRNGVDFKKMRTMVSNQREALTHSYEPSPQALKEIDALIRSLDRRITSNLEMIRKLVDSSDEIRDKVRLVETITGIGFITAATIIAETDGFCLMTSRKQVASYAGLDVVARDSGSKTPRRHISKQGNVHIRRALFMSAMSAALHNPQMKDLYGRICRKSNLMVARTAVMRKLLELAYTLCKNRTEYDPEKLK